MMKKTAIHIIGAFTALVIVLSLVFGCGVFLFGCKSKNDKEITGVTVNNLDIYYLTTSTIDFDAVTLTVTYDDGTTEVLSKKEYDIKDKEAADDTEFILNTDGLYDAVKDAEERGVNLEKGNYKFSYSIPSYKYSKKIDTVTIGDNYQSDLQALYYSDPDFIYQYKTRIEDAYDRSGDEDTFFVAPEKYYVGDDNGFVFKPELFVTNMTTGAMGTFSGYESGGVNVSLTDGDGTNLDIDEYVSCEGFTAYFTEEAIDKTFTVTATPPDMTLLYGSGFGTVSMDVTVADGWNVYSAKDLGMMNVTSSEINRQDYVITDANDNRSDYNQQLSGEYFWDEETWNKDNKMAEKDTVDIWTDFLTENGYTDPEPVNGMFLHGDIYVTANDVPEDFLITESEARTLGYNYDEMIGSMRDGMKLYEKYMEEDDFTFNGNLFTVDCSQLKWAMTYIDSDGNFEHYAENKTTTYRGGRLSLFAVQGKTDIDTDPDTRPTATFENLGGVGNAIDSNDVEGKEGGSYAFIESLSSQTVVDNCHAKNFLYGLRAEDSDESYVNFTVKNTKVYDCYFAGMRLSRSASNEVYNSEFKRFSGPAIFLMSELEKDAPKYGGYYKSGVINDEDTVLENYIDGSEAWFVSSGATSIKSYITMADSLIQVCSADANGNPTKTITREDGKMNLTIFEQATDDFSAGGAKMNAYYGNGDAVPFVLNESTIGVKDDGTRETLDDFEGDVALYNAASINYFVDGLSFGAFTPIPALFGSNTGKLVAIDNGYNGFYNPVDLRDNDGAALGEDYTVSLGPDDNQLYVYYRMDDSLKNTSTGLCLVVDLIDIV